MSFGGGGGSSGITTNAAGEGGNLTTATLHPSTTMTLEENIFLKAVEIKQRNKKS